MQPYSSNRPSSSDYSSHPDSNSHRCNSRRAFSTGPNRLRTWLGFHPTSGASTPQGWRCFGRKSIRHPREAQRIRLPGIRSAISRLCSRLGSGTGNKSQKRPKQGSRRSRVRPHNRLLRWPRSKPYPSRSSNSRNRQQFRRPVFSSSLSRPWPTTWAACLRLEMVLLPNRAAKLKLSRHRLTVFQRALPPTYRPFS